MTRRCRPAEEWSRSGWLHSFLRVVMMGRTPSEGSDALPDMIAATDLDLSTCLYSSTCNAATLGYEIPSIGWQSFLTMFNCYCCYLLLVLYSCKSISAHACMQAAPVRIACIAVCNIYPVCMHLALHLCSLCVHSHLLRMVQVFGMCNRCFQNSVLSIGPQMVART